MELVEVGEALEAILGLHHNLGHETTVGRALEALEKLDGRHPVAHGLEEVVDAMKVWKRIPTHQQRVQYCRGRPAPRREDD